MLKTQLQTRQT